VSKMSDAMYLGAYGPLQQKALIVTPMISGVVSAISSATILYLIRKNHRLNQGRLGTYDKIMAAFSVLDFIGSLNIATSSTTVPKETGVWLAVGNQATCEAQAFISSWQLGAYLYNISICVLSLALVRYKKKESWVKKHLEPYFIWMPALVALVGSTVPFKYQVYNYDGFTRCFFAASPIGCNFVPDVECERGEYATIIAWFVLGIPFIFTMIFIVGVMVVLYLSTLKRFSDSQTPATSSNMERTNPTIPGGIQNDSSINTRNDVETPRVDNLERLRIRNRERERQSRDAAILGILYSLGFFFTQIFIFVRRLYEIYALRTVPYAVFLLDRIFFPLQGLFNLAIFKIRRSQSQRTTINI